MDNYFFFNCEFISITMQARKESEKYAHQNTNYS